MILHADIMTPAETQILDGSVRAAMPLSQRHRPPVCALEWRALGRERRTAHLIGLSLRHQFGYDHSDHRTDLDG
jgi:hypothetical protein